MLLNVHVCVRECTRMHIDMYVRINDQIYTPLGLSHCDFVSSQKRHTGLLEALMEGLDENHQRCPLTVPTKTLQIPRVPAVVRREKVPSSFPL